MLINPRGYKVLNQKEFDFLDPRCELLLSESEVYIDDDKMVRFPIDVLLDIIDKSGFKIIKK